MKKFIWKITAVAFCVFVLFGCSNINTITQKEKGWQILITITQPTGKIKQYSVIDDKLKIDHGYYKVSKDFINNLEKLYAQIDTPEEKY